MPIEPDDFNIVKSAFRDVYIYVRDGSKFERYLRLNYKDIKRKERKEIAAALKDTAPTLAIFVEIMDVDFYVERGYYVAATGQFCSDDNDPEYTKWYSTFVRDRVDKYRFYKRALTTSQIRFKQRQ